MSVLSNVLKYIQLAPLIVAGVETIAGENATGASKKQMAQDALQFAVAGAAAVSPDNAQTVQATGAAVSSLIDSIVATLNATGAFKHK